MLNGTEMTLVNFDNTAPEINITSPINVSFVKHAVDVEGYITDTNLLSYTISIDGAAVSNSLPYLWDTFASGDGAHTVRIIAADKAGNTASKEITVTIDNTLPRVEIKFPPDRAFVKGVVDLTVDVFDAYIDKFRIFINGVLVAENQKNFSWNTTQQPDGAYIIELVAYDKVGNEKRTSINVTVDNTAPIINITNPVKGSFVKQQVTVDADIIEANPDKLELRLDGTTISGILPYQWNTLSYPDGPHTIAVYANDSAGNEAVESATVTVDNTLPQVNITSPADGSYLREVVNITGTASDANLDRISLTINSTEVSTSLPFEFNSSAYAEGSYLIRLTAFDKANNSASDEVMVNVDNTAPMLIVNELTENPTLDNPEYSLFIQTDIGANVTVNEQPISLTDGSAIYSRNITEGRNTFEITASDTIGNQATWNITRLIDSDSLPDYYEINVTRTDPLDGDSDSSITAVNEAHNGIPDDKEDFDGDSLPNNVEMKLGTNPFSDDTDGDELVDLFEVYFSGTNPTIVDTDGDGIKDGDEDIDMDGLTNLEEQNFGTNPDDRDTDGDNLFDGKEITLGTNPLNPDSDGDGLQDGMEVDTGSNPLLKDSDQDGIPDGKETIVQEIVRGEVNLTITGEGEISNTLRVSNISKLEVFSGMPGNIGKVFEIRTNSSFESVTIKIPYDESALGDIPENDLRIFTVNETTHRVDFLPTIVNTANNYVQTTTNHFSLYGVAGYTKWLTTWNSGSNPTTPEFKMGDRVNIKAMVHNTGDAAVNDNVLVYFYAGNPDAGGSYLGSATITGGIIQGGAKTAVLYGYTISSSAVDIYVKVDPLNSITEKSESNNKAYKTLSIGPQNFDSDGDGLTDYDETNGMRTNFGTIKTDPNNRDTDGDGLSDAEEMGTRYNDRYYLNSNPQMVDSDGDGIDDLAENEYGIEPLISDTDYDGLNDGEEFGIGTDPSLMDTDGDGYNDYVEFHDSDHSPLIYEKRYSLFEISREVVLGAVFGEWKADVYDSLYYFGGWMLSGFLAVGDIRDLASSIVHGDGLGALLNALSLIPSYGDAAKVTTTIGKFVAKNPHMIFAVAGFVVKHIDESIDVIRKTYGDAIVDALKTNGLKDNDITKLVAKNIDLNELKFVRKISDDVVVYITKERWGHIIGRHIDGSIKPNKYTSFFPTGKKVSADIIRTEFTLPKTMEDSNVADVVFEAIERTSPKPKFDNIDEYIYNPGKYGISEMIVWVEKSTGKIITAFPKKGTAVRTWTGLKWEQVV